MSSSAAAVPSTPVLKLQRVKLPTGSLDPAFLRELAARFPITAFVETGTFLGNTTAAAAEIFPVVHTIELAAQLAAQARVRFANAPTVHVHEGDSAEMLKSIVGQINGPALYWLDGHFSEGETARGQSNTPILEELTLIAHSGRKDALILVDDLRLFDTPRQSSELAPSVTGYPSIQDLHQAVLAIDSGYQFYVYGDIALAVPGSMPCPVSPLVQALTISRLFDGRNLPAEEVITAESLIGGSKAGEKDALRQLVEFGLALEKYGLGSHYRLWNAIGLIADNRAADACDEFRKLADAGFSHWRLYWYLAIASHVAGQNDAAREILAELVNVLPDFAPAKALLATLQAASEPQTARPTVAKSDTGAAQLPSRPTTLDDLKARRVWTEGSPLRLHLGCGEQRFQGYINIDYPSDQHNVMAVRPDFEANITQMHFPPGTVDEIRLHHVFEHFNRVTALAMLIKWQEWLKVGGVLYIETPDLMGCAQLLVSDVPWSVKMGNIRHLAGDQAASWAYHLDHWFPERYRHTLEALGFGNVQVQSQRWPHSPYLSNVHAHATKVTVQDREKLLAIADGLLLESTVAAAEAPTHAVWTRQLRDALRGSTFTAADIAAVQPKPAAPAPAASAPAPAIPKLPTLPPTPGPEVPLAEIHDFNQRGRDKWMAAKAATVPSGARVLDMGAGTCLYRPLFAHCVYKTHDFKQYTGVKHGNTTEYGQIDYVSDILAIPAEDHSFDVVVCTEVLEHVPEPIGVLREISRLLKPGGRAFISAPLGSGLHQLPFHFYGGYTPEWYKRFCGEAGMDAREITPNGGFFKHLAQECARASSLYAQKPELHGPGSAELFRLLQEQLPKFFFALDDKCFDERFTVGYFVEAVKTGAKLQAPTPAGGEQQSLAPTSNSRVTANPETRKPTRAAPPKSGRNVVTKLMGGLGNQMFQYAAGLALARRHDARLQLDLTFLEDQTPRPHFTPRAFELGAFPLAAECELVREPGQLAPGLRHVQEKQFHFDPEFDGLGADVHLDGYWQSPKYFATVADEVRKHFCAQPALDAEATAMAGEIAGCDAVCLHVRRGDMVHDAQTAAVHGTCTAEYYRSACDIIARVAPHARFFVFSDDPEWCQSVDLTHGRPRVIASRLTTAANPAVDLYLMRQCKHFITANSTLSWWAAFLGADEGKQVVVPEPWFGDLSKDISDLFPSEWIRLSRCPGPVVTDLAAAPVVSVVTPCYKQAHYLSEVVESVVAQTFADWELIIVDDGSPDNTGEVAREIIALHPDRRIRLIQKPNGGLADARNAGIRVARGRYILPLDADDKVHPQMLEKTVALLEQDPRIGVAYTDLVHFGAVNKLVRAAEYDFAHLVQQNQLNACSLFRREAWEAVGGYSPTLIWGYEDWNFWVACGAKGFVGKHLPEPLLFYRVKNSSMYTNAVKHHRELCSQVVLNNPELYDENLRNDAAKFMSEELGKPVTGYRFTSPASRPLVSVVIPCYNQGEYLSDAVQSVLGQRYSAWEIIMVDDGSTDSSNAVAKSLIRANRGSRLRLIEQPNGGLAAARNAGVAAATGRYILPLDADDRIHPEALAKMVALLEADPKVAIAYCDWQYFGAENRTRCAIDYDFQRLCTQENLFTCTSLFRKEAWTAVGGYNSNMTHGVEDWDFWIGCGEKGFVGRRIPEVLFYYRAKPGSMIHTLQPHLKAMFARIVLNHPQLYGASNVDAARKVFDQAGLPAPKPTSAGVEWLPASETEAQKLLGQAEAAVANRNYLQAVKCLRSAFELSMTPEDVKRAEAIVALVPKPGASSPAPTPASPATDAAPAEEGDFFGPEEIRSIEQLINQYRANPSDAAAVGQLQELRRAMVEFLGRTEVAKLERMFAGDFGRVFRMLAASGISSEVAPAEQGAMAQSLAESGDTLDLARLLACLLCVPAHRIAVPMLFEQVPSWCLDDVLSYLLAAPQSFTVPGEADQYLQHQTALGAAITQRVRKAPADSLTLRLATEYAMKLNCIPAYVAHANTRELMQHRASALEFVLTRHGAALDANLEPSRGKKIRVGFVSAHFSEQTETHVTLPALHLDRSRFEVWLFPLKTNDSPVEARCRSLADHFVPLPNELGRQVATVRNAGLDVIIIGTNVTAVTNAVSLLAAHRLAPVQLVSYCSPMTTGLRNVDGYLYGSLSQFDGAAAHFSEDLVVCEGAPGCLDYTGEKPATMRFDRKTLGIADDDVLFINAASCFKIPVELQETWAQLLQRVPKSRLLLLPFNPNWSSSFPVQRFAQTLHAALRRHGVAEDRVVMANSLPSRAEVKELEKLGDVYLDTFPFSGSLSVIDPLEIGLPTVVWQGKSPRSRAAASLLRAVGLDELVTGDEASYLALSVRLGSDRDFRLKMAATVRAAMEKTPKFLDPVAYGSDLSNVLDNLVRGKQRHGKRGRRAVELV